MEWISVKDRLPEIIHHHVENAGKSYQYKWSASDLVLTFNPNGIDGGSSIQTRYHQQRRLSYIEGDKWVHEGVTHWTPITPPEDTHVD